ncbi:MAG TPA: DEAD/DEAH box helicase family protein, partial [Alphaproteobacteria bacterium]|nr:DEAD/DEAH box helicase family protein [Alphaproteobacteria bacterium]
MSTNKAVLTPFPIDKAYDYALPETMEAQAGSYVCVPLGTREIPAVVWGSGVGDVKPEKIKPIISNYSLPPLPEVHRKFIDWVAGYTMAAKGAVLKLTLSVPKALDPPATITGYVLGEVKVDETGVSPAAKRVLEVAQDNLPRRASELAEEAECSTGVIKTLENKGFLKSVQLKTPPPCRTPDAERAGALLSAPQRECADTLVDMVRANKFSAALLDGVTGAGKTEVYFEAVAQALRQHKQVLILLPEIALSNAFLDRFKARFGCAPALWHSSLSPAKRKVTWRGVAEGQSRVVIGARSALFLPYQ